MLGEELSKMQEEIHTFQEELHKTSDSTNIVATSIDTIIKAERLGTPNGRPTSYRSEIRPGSKERRGDRTYVLPSSRGNS